MHALTAKWAERDMAWVEGMSDLVDMIDCNLILKNYLGGPEVDSRLIRLFSMLPI